VWRKGFGFVIVLAASAAISAPAGAATWREQSDQTFSVERVRTLRVENTQGGIEVVPGGAGTLRVTALKTTRANGDARARTLATETVVETQRVDGAFQLKVRYPQRNTVRIGWRDLFRGELLTPRSEVQLTIEIPANVALEIHAASADVSTRDLVSSQTVDAVSGDVTVVAPRGGVVITTVSGDVDVRDARSLEVRTVSGTIDVEQASGPLSLKSSSGGVSVSGARDSIVVRSVSGDVRVDAAPRGLTANTSSGAIRAQNVAHHAMLSSASGDIEVSFAEPLLQAQVDTVSGDITGRLADRLGCRIEMRTSGGDLDMRVPFKLQSVSRREITGVVNGGRAPILLESSAGDIELLSGGI